MILEAITLSVIGAYVTGDDQRRSKMRKIGSDLMGVAKDTAVDVFHKSKEVINKIETKHAEKKQDESC